VPSARNFKKYQDQASNALKNKKKEDDWDLSEVIISLDSSVVTYHLQIPQPMVLSPVVKAVIEHPAFASSNFSSSLLDAFSRGKTVFDLSFETSSYSLCSANISTLDQRFLST